MAKMNILIICMLFVLLCPSLIVIAQPNKNTTLLKKERSIDEYSLFPYEIDKEPEKTKERVKEIYTKYPPLRPERFGRRMKMLLGDDFSSYPDNSVILTGYFKIYKSHQLFERVVLSMPKGEVAPWDYPDAPVKDYDFLRAWIYYNSKEAYMYFANKLKIEGHIEDQLYGPLYLLENLFYIFSLTFPFDSRKECFVFNDNIPSATGDLSMYQSYSGKYEITSRSSDMRRSALWFYMMEEIRKGRTPRKYNKFMGISSDNIQFDYDNFYPFKMSYCPWKGYTQERDRIGFTTFLLSLNDTVANKIALKNILQAYTGYKDTIIANNYYGYTLLREFMTNPKREMPTLEKIGTSFRGKVKTTTKLLLEPFSESMDYDTINTDEAFTAYEMGYDDYYFIEIKKPVESPVAGPDGYAMIIDQTETVRGYLKKTDIEEIKGNSYATPDLLIIAKYKDAKTVKTGVINDPDGYVNIRAAGRMDAGIISKLEYGKEFKYWEITENTDWCIVETEKGVRGFVYKNRVVENKVNGYYNQ